MARKKSRFRFIKRLTSVLLLVAMFLGAGLLPPTFAHIAAETSVVQSLPDAQNLLQQGRELYEAERFSEAVAVWQQAIAAFQSSRDELRQALTLGNLSLAYQQLGQWTEAEGAIAQSLNLLQTAQNINPKRSQILAQALDIKGRLQLALSKAEEALNIWRQAIVIYAQIGDENAMIRNRINQAQALQTLGLYRQAQKTLTESTELLQNQPDSLLKATGLRSLGNVLLVTGDLKQSRQILQQSVGVASSLPNPQAIADALLILGNTTRAQQDTQAALQFYQQAANASTSPTTRIQAQVNQLSLLVETKRWSNAWALLPTIGSQIAELPASRTAIYARINLAQSLMKLGREEAGFDLSSAFDRALTPKSEGEQELISSALLPAQLLSTAVQQAKSLQDQRTESYALGVLGGLYEQKKQLSDAQNLTQQALLMAQAIDAKDIAYQWQWQLGRLLRARGDIQGAIAAYTEAVNHLQSLRRDLVAMNPEAQFSFRDQVEPVYRQLVELLLQPQGSSQPSSKNLYAARDTIESLQLAELDNFFREACSLGKRQIDQILDKEDQTAAAIYPIILPQSLEVILKLPEKPLLHYATAVAQNKVESTLNELRQNLREPDTLAEAKSLSQQVYNWLIKPAATELAQSNIKTLVFVLDGSLRNIPMAALYDGKQYLIEKYGITLTPGLQLVNPKSLHEEKLKAITAGLTEARSGFSALPNVKRELEEIHSLIPSSILLNNEFTSAALQNRVNSQPFPVVHLATHGQFSSKAEETFIVAWDERIYVNDLDNLVQNREQSRPNAIELLVLSACETATGDNRAALGLAGVAVRAGARSTIASLWNLDDESTAQLMGKFYQELANKALTKAEALRRAQLALLQNPKYQRPMFWAPYILLGNWL